MGQRKNCNENRYYYRISADVWAGITWPVRGGRSRRDFSTAVLRPIEPPIKCVLRLFGGGTAARAWSGPPTPSNAEVKERVELYLYSTSEPSWSVLG